MRTLLMMLAAVMALCNGLANTAGAQELISPDMPIEETYRQGIGTPVGKVVRALGQVVVIHRGEAVGCRAKEGLDLYEADTVVCLEESQAVLEMADGSRLSLAAATRLKLTRSVFSAREKDRSAFFHQIIGKTRFVITKMADFKRSEVRVMTPTAIVGVRGSDFVIMATEAATRVTTLDDTLLEVFNKLLPEQPPVMLAAFQQSLVEGAAPPSPPLDITPEQAAEIVRDVPADPQNLAPEKEAAPAAAGATEPAAATLETTAAGASLTGTPAATTACPPMRVEDAALVPPETPDREIPPAPETPYVERLDTLQREEITRIQETQDNSLKNLQEENLAVQQMPDFPKPPR